MISRTQHRRRIGPRGITRVEPRLQGASPCPSSRLARYQRTLGISDARKTFHSFRHTLIDDLRDAGVQDSLIKRIAGHEDGSVTFSVYGSRSPVRAMADALDCIHPFFGIT
ncbi:Phage integrase family protein [compost metagenome]